LPWNNYQGFGINGITVKYKNIIALDILFNRDLRLKNNLFNFFNLNPVG
jgi:hypothetical protein